MHLPAGLSAGHIQSWSILALPAPGIFEETGPVWPCPVRHDMAPITDGKYSVECYLDAGQPEHKDVGKGFSSFGLNMI